MPGSARDEKVGERAPENFVMFDVKRVDIKIEIVLLEDFNAIKDHYNSVHSWLREV